MKNNTFLSGYLAARLFLLCFSWHNTHLFSDEAFTVPPVYWAVKEKESSFWTTFVSLVIRQINVFQIHTLGRLEIKETIDLVTVTAQHCSIAEGLDCGTWGSVRENLEQSINLSQGDLFSSLIFRPHNCSEKPVVLTTEKTQYSSKTEHRIINESTINTKNKYSACIHIYQLYKKCLYLVSFIPFLSWQSNCPWKTNISLCTNY